MGRGGVSSSVKTKIGVNYWSAYAKTKIEAVTKRNIRPVLRWPAETQRGPFQTFNSSTYVSFNLQFLIHLLFY